MKCIIGLGNPGKEYSQSRHNLGFLAIDHFSKILGIEKKWKKEKTVLINLTKEDAKKGVEKGGANLILAKPQTFMNDSGKAVLALKKKFKLKNKDIIVVHDDLDLELFETKIQFNRGSAGHKGVESIISCLDTKAFWRMRIGISVEAGAKLRKADVLENFSAKELVLLAQKLDGFWVFMQNWLRGGYAQNKKIQQALS